MFSRIFKGITHVLKWKRLRNVNASLRCCITMLKSIVTIIIHVKSYLQWYYTCAEVEKASKC